MIFTIPALTPSEQKAIEDLVAVRDRFKYTIRTPRRWLGVLRRNSLARALRGSNSIEGYIVTAEDAIAAIEGEDPLDAESETWAAIEGYRNAMTYVMELSADPHFAYSDGLLRSLHFMMMHYDLSKHPGRWRTGPIYVRDEQSREIIYEGPDAELVPGLMGELLTSLDDDTPTIVRAAMAHLNLVMIHPFSDGNGRMARCLQTLVLAREGILEPTFSSIEEYLGRNTQDYYKVLKEVGSGTWSPKSDARPWIHFCLTAHHRQAATMVRRTKEIERIWGELEEIVKMRGLPERVIYALVDATMGFRVRNATYRNSAEVTDSVASRDFKSLVDQGLLVPSGEKRGRAYIASPILVAIKARTREPRGPRDEPVLGR
jgi:Fic family protein